MGQALSTSRARQELAKGISPCARTTLKDRCNVCEPGERVTTQLVIAKRWQRVHLLFHIAHAAG